MFAWLGKLFDGIAAWIYRRGAHVAEAETRAASERRDAIRRVRDAIATTMTHAERDREHGGVDDRESAVGSANEAAAIVGEIEDDEARQLVAAWKASWDAVPKGWSESYLGSRPGYPEPAWDELRTAARDAQERLGTVLRDLLARN